ncbi:ciliogenesis and planar polarity effector 1 isoform X7 [Pogona vitticeps]
MMMEIKLEVLASTCIKQNKPWPRITWLGQEKEAVYLLDEKNINEINLFSGKTKKKIPQLCHLLKNVILLTTSRNGAWLAGILKTGELFLWNKDQDTIKMVPLADEVKKVVMATQEYSRRFYLYVSGDGNKALVTTPTVCVFLWENMECQSSPSKNPVAGQWSQIIPEASILLPSVEEKETAMSADFIKTEMLGDICLCSFAFYSDENLMLIFLEIRWQENALTNARRIHWAQQQCCLTGLAPPCEPVKSRGALLTAFSHDGLTLAVAVNQKDLQTSQILFMNTTNFVMVTGSLKGCGAKNHKISSKVVRSYWIADMTWTTDSLFLACMLKRGSLILMTCLGELLTLVTFGCSVEFGPAEFIPLHPLIMYRSQNSLLQDLNHCHDSSASEGDLMRQRFSITSHPSLPYLITSDGYIVTVLRFSDGFSPSAYMRSLLLDSAQRLEKLRHNLITSKSKEKRLPLQPLSSLRANLLQQHLNQNCSFSTIPKFLQEEKRAAEVNGESTCIQDYSDDSDDDKMFQSHSFIWGSPKAAVSSCDEGRLEFASMFDTIHAVDCPGEKDDTSLELNCIQKNLIAAWRMGISSSIQERDKLLSYTIRCITHFFNILQYTKLNFVHLNNAFGNRPWMQCVLKCFQQFLTVLSWESKHRHTLGHLMKLTLQTLKLMLAEQQDGMFSSSLLGGFSLLKIVSHYLNGKNIPQYATFSTLLNINNVELDSITTPLFRSVDCNSHQSFCSLDSIQKASPATVNLTKNSENRLIVMWRLLYKHVLWYWAELNKKAQNSSKAIKEKLLANEGPLTGALATHIQAVLQSSGEKLEQTFCLNSVSGEERFLVGSYQESVDAWERALQEAKAKGGKRMPFLQTRYYLAMLYCHLYHYGLTEAQGLCDRLVSELLRRTQIFVRDRDDESEAGWITNSVSTEAALAVVQCLARFMAAYFTNEPLYVLPPHRVDILPPLHIRPDRCSRVIPLEHSVVADAVRNQGLSGVWTVEYALDLLLVGGLIPEAVWLTHKLGDWKMAVSVGVAFNLYCQSNNRFSRSETVELCLPPHLTPTHIFQEKLQSFLGQAVNNGTSNQGDKSRYKQLTDPIEEESACVLFNSVEEILKAAVMAEADIVSETFLLLVNFAKELSRKLNGLVPDTLYLPAPPLYCPQPALANEEEHTDLSLTMERNSRQKVSRVIQRILLLFRAAHCSLPAAQWYIIQLKRARKIMQKIRKKVALPSLSTLPENLLNYSKDGSMFSKPTSSGDHKLDYVSCKTIASFRDLCALCWMLHVRDMLSDSCRRYQTAREKMEHQKECKRTEFDACIVECSLTALEWASRMLPFAHFMNIEELVQDIILSLIGELPPIRKVAEILVKAFPNPEDVRVPLRDKYSALQRRLQHCIVKGPSSEEMMAVVIQAVHKVNVKTLKCVIRNIGPYEKNIWEPPEEETQDPGACCYDKLSLGTSLSRSTISDLGNSQIYSDAETAESLSEALLVEETKKHIRTQMEENNKEIHHEELIRCNKTAEKLEDFSVKERRNKKENTKDITNQHVLPLKLHDGSASVCSSTLESKIEDSFMDTSCSPSAGISVGIPDSHVLGKPSENAPGILQEKQHEKKESDLKGHFVTHDRMIGGTDCDVGLKKEMGEFTPSKVEVTSENEDYCEDPFAVSRSPTISVSITSVQQKKEHQSLADVQCPQEDVFVKTLEGNATKLESPPCRAIPSNVPCSICPEMKTEFTSKEITVSDNQPSFTVVSSALSSDPSGPKNEEMGAREPASQPAAQSLNISDAVREMLQDEMFKLVQLQQINFMSLMQVVGASFANLPNISQQMQQSQPFQLERSQTPNIAGTDVARSPPRHPADGFLKAQMASLENSSHVRSKNINPQGKDNLLDQQSYNRYVLNPPQTNDSSGLPENQSNEKNQIPPFQSLLHQIPARPLPLLSACLKDEKKPKLIPLAKPLNTADGLPLLKLKPQCEFQLLNVCPVTPPRAFIGPQPQRKECWGAQASFVKNPQSETTAHLNLNNYDHRAIKQAQEQASNQVEILSKETSKQDHLDRYGKTEDISLHHFQAHLRGEKSLADNETLLQKTYEHFTPFPLLYLKPWSQSKHPSELITVKCLGKDKDFKEPCGRTALPLLYANLSPPIKFQTPKLIPLQNLIVFKQSRHIAQAPHTGHKDHPEQIQLLKADLKSLEARQDRNSKKRQKRRTERRIREKKEREKTAVTFQQDDAVDLTDTVKQTKDNGVVFNYSFSDGDSLLNQDAVNVAELHYLASVRKRVAELQDASTNTETVLTSHQDIQTLSEDIIYETGINQPLLSVSASATGFKSHQDMQGVSEEINSEPSKNEPVASPSASEKEPLPSGVPQTLPPDLYWNLTFPTEAAEKPLPSTSSDVVSDLIGQKYISVIDIENGGDLKNLPGVSESPPKCIPTQAVKTELPTSAKQHHTAASVTNVISPEEFEKQGNTFQTESQQVLPETGEAEIVHDPLTLCLLRKDFSINSSTELSAKKISKERLSAKLQEMDRQLLTLQNVADRMEKEFHNTKLLVETIEDIGVIADPGKDDMLFLAPGVKVTKEERYSIHEIMENSAEGSSLECESFQAIYIDSRAPSVSPSASAATLRIKKSSSDINFRTEEFDESFSDPLQMTGLSGVSDIITDLIAEGGISASELGLTENQAKKISSFTGEMNKYSRKTKRDKKELQAWMKRKRKERLAEYMQTLAERRAREHSPFPLRKNMHLALSTRDFKMQQKKKEEKDKALFSEHHNHRVSEALVLMHELLSDTVQLPSSDYKQMPKITSPHDFKRPHIASARSYHGSCQATRKMVAAKAGFSQTKSFSNLPSDVTQRRGQICQAPYRRMASEARSQKQWSSNKLDLQSPASHQTRKSMNQRRLPTAETATEASEESDDAAMSSWSVPDEIQQILYGSSNFNKETSQEDGCSIASLNHFDSVSESTSSILSKLDWNAVEAMVANVEEK